MRDYGDFAGVVAFAIYFALFSIVVERLVFGRLSRRVFRWRPAMVREVSEPPEVTAP
jgi:ABC-type nitrate/sulfonate/bicarbonate transport system permease component